MLEYANDSVIRALKQYDMLAKSLKLIADYEQRQDISLQMTKIIQRVLELTNNIYENKYLKLENKTTYLMDDEKNRLIEIVNLIIERKEYINNQIASNEELTGITIDPIGALGEEKLNEYQEEIDIIEQYKKNANINNTLREELAQLNISIKKAKEKIGTNKIVNRQLEDKMKRILNRAIEKFSLKELKEREKEIDLAYTELGYSLEKAKENAKIARKECTSEIILECDNMLSSITLEYERYKEKKLILQLMEIYNDEVHDYDELLNKRERINKILSNITSSELYQEVGEELNKEYASIKLEQQDKATLKSLEEEKENKIRILESIKEENESEKFRGILSHLLENERKYQQQLLEKKKQEEAERRAREIEQEKIRKREFLKRQKALEEERKKEIEERTKQLLVEKKNPILFTSKNESINEKNELYHHRKETNINQKIYDTPKKEVQPVKPKIYKPEIYKPEVPRTINVKPKDDIFSRKITPKRTDDNIPVIKNNNLRNDYIYEKKKTNLSNEIFPKTKLKKEENIFPDFPDMSSNDSFFDKDELEDLNNYMEDDTKKSWF
ncbi:MAG: hypothetical protein VZS44_04695 [Bacilli bacterium]|nr:hypothetical protein [Bacilli bacterium]